MEKTRPKFLDLTSIRLPVPGWVSILHRISGALLFVSIPLLLWLLDQSLHSSTTYRTFQAAMGNPLVKLVLLGLVWAFLHHLCAGIRYLALDMHMGTTLEKARASSKAVLGVSLVLTAVLGARLW